MNKSGIIRALKLNMKYYREGSYDSKKDAFCKATDRWNKSSDACEQCPMNVFETGIGEGCMERKIDPIDTNAAEKERELRIDFYIEALKLAEKCSFNEKNYNSTTKSQWSKNIKRIDQKVYEESIYSPINDELYKETLRKENE